MHKIILLVHNGLASFVRMDRDILAECYHVIDRYERSPRHLKPIAIWRQVRRADLIFCWFASWHSLLPVVFARMQRKPSLVVIGGYDVADLPEIGYGHQRGGLRCIVSRFVCRWATQLLAFSDYSYNQASNNARVAPCKMEMRYLGIPDAFGQLSRLSKEPLVITVGNVNRLNLRRKGHESFVCAASLLPNVQFALVGQWQDDAIEHLRAIASSNVIFTGWISDEALVDIYRRASVYVQASAHEGFGLSVAEAMLAGCVPVVTRAGALPEVVGNCGIYVDSTESQALARAIYEGLACDDVLRCAARRRILVCFPFEGRRRELLELVERMMGK